VQLQECFQVEALHYLLLATVVRIKCKNFLKNKSVFAKQSNRGKKRREQYHKTIGSLYATSKL
jgi:hypothetical protein